jgi:hypothetical protein
MAKQKPTQNHAPIKCNFPPDEALRLAMLVKPPKTWKKAIRSPRRKIKS